MDGFDNWTQLPQFGYVSIDPLDLAAGLAKKKDLKYPGNRSKNKKNKKPHVK